MISKHERKTSMTNRKKEIAKFACGAEAFHAWVHAYFWLSGTTLTVFGIHYTAPWMLAGLVLNAAISIALGVYAWRPANPSQ